MKSQRSICFLQWRRQTNNRAYIRAKPEPTTEARPLSPTCADSQHEQEPPLLQLTRHIVLPRLSLSTQDNGRFSFHSRAATSAERALCGLSRVHMSNDNRDVRLVNDLERPETNEGGSAAHTECPDSNKNSSGAEVYSEVSFRDLAMRNRSWRPGRACTYFGLPLGDHGDSRCVMDIVQQYGVKTDKSLTLHDHLSSITSALGILGSLGVRSFESD